MRIKINGYTSGYELINEIRKYDFWHAIEAIGNASIRIDRNPEIIQGKTVNTWMLSRIAYYFVKYGNIFGSKKMNNNNLFRINDLVINLHEPFCKNKNLPELFGRLTREQFPHQYGYGEQITRYYWILTQNQHLSEIKNDFESKHNLTIQLYYQIFFYVSGNRKKMKSSRFEYQSLIDVCSEWESKYDFCKIKNIESFFSLVSNSLENIKKEGDSINKNLESKYLKYEFNSLDTYPIINQFLGKKYCYIPNYESLQIKMSTGLYYHFQNIYNNGGKDNAFLEQIGYAFEEYIGWMLKNYFGSESVKKVDEVIELEKKKGQSGENADWLVFINDEIFIFECKARLLGLLGRQTYESSHIKSFLKKTVSKGCQQLHETEKVIKKEYPKKKITKFFVILDDFVFRKDIFYGLMNNSGLETNIFDDVIMTTSRGIERLDSVLKEKSLSKICKL
ncbi:MAG: hypothetical protein OEL54_04975, partial [Flavobacteriaceae bacterium]|nr:hypothetical protein [Flavobacteriaceae bacterium]